MTTAADRFIPRHAAAPHHLKVCERLALPANLDTTALPWRVQQMLALVLEHQDVLCRYATGTLELHFHGGSVKPKIGLTPG